MRKKRLLLIIILASVLLLFIIYPWMFLHLGVLLSFGPSAPKNTYGEFPFHIVYEVGGELFEIEDVLIVEYVGRGMDDMRGKHLKWEGRLASGNMINRGQMVFQPGRGTEWIYGFSIVLLDRVPVGNGCIGTVEIDIGSAQYYLGYYNLGVYEPGGVFSGSQGILDEDSLWVQYRIKIIETAFSEPMIGNGIEMIQK